MWRTIYRATRNPPASGATIEAYLNHMAGIVQDETGQIAIGIVNGHNVTRYLYLNDKRDTFVVSSRLPGDKDGAIVAESECMDLRTLLNDIHGNDGISISKIQYAAIHMMIHSAIFRFCVSTVLMDDDSKRRFVEDDSRVINEYVDMLIDQLQN